MLDYIESFLGQFWGKLVELAEWLLDSILSLIGWIFFTLFDLALTIVYNALAAVDITETAVINAFDSWGLLPPALIWLLNYLDLHLVLIILASAYTIRLILNIIPASLTRV